MAKRYHHKLASDHYAGHDDRRRQEVADSHMISEDHSCIANMPETVIMREWPKEHEFMADHLDDTISGIDHQMMGDAQSRNRGTNPRKA